MKIFDIFKKNKSESIAQEPTKESNTYIDIVISLTKNYEIDLTLWIDDKLDNKPMSSIDYALLCSEFLNNINSKHTKAQIIDILSKQVKTSFNDKLISSIISLMNYADNIYLTKENSFIKPSTVFTKHIQ